MTALTSRRSIIADSRENPDSIENEASGDEPAMFFSDSLGTVGSMSRQTLISVVSDDGFVTAVPLVDWDDTSQAIDSLGYHLLKRCLDVVGAVAGLILLSPVILGAMFLVWLEDGGPVLFRQTRVGLHGRRFQIYKIRSMVRNAEQKLTEVQELNRHDDQRTFKAENDPRVLKIGRLLRKFSVDEFPQLFNVLRGEMSLVGPRPPIPSEVELYEPHDYVRLAVKPGLTCYWQVSGRSTIPFKGQVELDRQYIHQASTKVDLQLICQTIPALFRGTGAE